jgi:DNA-directed RNA polymerase sigma subunit (sigma70/sigma32)
MAILAIHKFDILRKIEFASFATLYQVQSLSDRILLWSGQKLGFCR